jgi:hypothetical protein
MRKNIIEILTEEHQVLIKMIGTILSNPDPEERKSIYLDLREILITHITGEERTLFKNLLKNKCPDKISDQIDKVEFEQDKVRELLESLDSHFIESSEWETDLLHLKAQIERHIERLEEELFIGAGEELNHQDLVELALEYESIKKQVPLF